MPKRKYTKEHVAYVRKVAQGRYNDEITILFNEKFGMNLTEDQLKSFKTNHKIKSNVPRRKTKPEKLFSPEQEKFIKENVVGTGNRELRQMFNNHFGTDFKTSQIKAYKHRNNLSSGLDGRFEKGHVPANKGTKGLYNVGGNKTSFKPGQTPLNYRPVGSERIDNKDGYILIKVQDKGLYQERWRHKHVVVWENHHRKKVPKNHAIMFADSNKQNLDIDNLLLISRGELARMNQQDLFSTDPEITKAGLNMVRLNNKIMDYEYFRTNPEEFERYLRIAKTNGLTEQGFKARLKRGWSLEEALYKPKHYRMKRNEVM